MNTILDECDNDIHITGLYKTHPTARSHYARSGKTYVHRIVMSRMLGRSLSSKERVDHINGNGLDCRRSNLRLVDGSQNSANRPGWRNSSSKYKGVTFNTYLNKWQAKISPHGKTKHLGYYADEVDAAKAYDSAAISVFGEYVKINLEIHA